MKSNDSGGGICRLKTRWVDSSATGCDPGL